MRWSGSRASRAPARSASELLQLGQGEDFTPDAPAAVGTAAHVPPARLTLLDQLGSTPARIMTDLHETVVQNKPAEALPGPPVRDYLYRWFAEPATRSIYPEDDHPHHSKVLVSDLRAAVARRGADPGARDLVARLHRTGDEFVALWETSDVAVRRGERKRINHAELGVLDINCQNLFREDGRQRLPFFTAPPGSPAVDQLRLLAVIGTQTLSPSGLDHAISWQGEGGRS